MGTRTIAGYAATLADERIGDDSIALWQVADLERHVDRRALLAGDDPAEPPYWAHLWCGARLLAEAIPSAAGRVLEIGCGLGLPGLVAARRGACVTFVDRVAAPLHFVRASAAANGITNAGVVAGDFTRLPLRAAFDLVLAAEILYDRTAFAELVGAFARLAGDGGRVLLTDAGRIDTRGFYEALGGAGLGWRATDHRVREEGVPITVRLVEVGSA